MSRISAPCYWGLSTSQMGPEHADQGLSRPLLWAVIQEGPLPSVLSTHLLKVAVLWSPRDFWPAPWVRMPP